jgi:preprotein translocase subunit SecE
VAEKEGSAKKKRVRKSAPTVRERQEAALAKSEDQQPGLVKRTATAAAKPVKRLKLRDRKAVRIITYPIRLLGRLLYKITPKYFINSWHEVRKVVWPSRKETWRLTLAVFIFATVFGALVAVVDKGLDAIFKNVILK